MPNPTYATATTVRAWTNPKYGPNKLYTITPYKTGSAVTADIVTDLSESDADNLFQQMINDSVTGGNNYDQIVMTEQLVTCPS